jgi:hypothetical protein
MNSRPGLEALKATIRERGADTNKTSEKILEALPRKGVKGAKVKPRCPLRLATSGLSRRSVVRGERRSAG